MWDCSTRDDAEAAAAAAAADGDGGNGGGDAAAAAAPSAQASDRPQPPLNAQRDSLFKDPGGREFTIHISPSL